MSTELKDIGAELQLCVADPNITRCGEAQKRAMLRRKRKILRHSGLDVPFTLMISRILMAMSKVRARW
jgi:hypothetical protein